MLALTLMIILSSCSKSDSTADMPLPTPVASNYRVTKDRNDYNYEYNTQGKLSKVKSNTNTLLAEYSYNSLGVLTKISGDYRTTTEFNYENFTYNNNGTIAEKIIDNKQPGNPASKSKYVYEYDANNNIKKIVYYNYNSVSNTFSTLNNYNQNFVYDQNNRLIKIFGNGFNNLRDTDYMEFIYDTNGNMIEEKTFVLKTAVGSTGVYLAQSKAYTYDNKKYYRKGIVPKSIQGSYGFYELLEGNREHNVVDTTNKNYSETGLTSSGTSTNIYEYNDGGYPTKLNDGFTIYNFTYEKY